MFDVCKFVLFVMFNKLFLFIVLVKLFKNKVKRSGFIIDFRGILLWMIFYDEIVFVSWFVVSDVRGSFEGGIMIFYLVCNFF